VGTVEALVGSDKRLALVAKDLVTHFEDRLAALDGKAMVVCMSRRICVALYDEIVKLRPDWHSTDDNAGAVKIVMTGAASDPRHGSSTSATRCDAICSPSALVMRKIR
jgi:type I restriction enzyme R subunit